MSADAKAPVSIVVPDDFPSVFENTTAHERCRKVGETRVFTARGADEENELIKRIDSARVAINIRAHARFTDRVMESCKKLQMISIWGTGTDNIDLDAAGRHGITVCNTPGINAFAVAEHALALMLATARRIPRIDREVRGGAWPRDLLTQLLGKALGMVVLAFSARGDAAAVAGLGARAASKEDILRRADVVSLHLRLAPDTRGFLGRREFAMMKPTAILINPGRGALVEREALLDALTQNKLGGAGLDVFHDEPIKPGDPLLALANVVLSPHNAGQTPEVIRDGLLRAIENVESYLAGKPTDVVVAPVKARR